MIPRIRKILYATDLTENSSYAFLYAIDMARRYEAKIVVLHCVKPGRTISYAGSRIEGMTVRVQQERHEMGLEETEKSVWEFCRRIRTQTSAPCDELISKIIILLGHPVGEILKVADEENCCAIVLGIHRKGLLTRTFLGSVAASVLEWSRKPVFVIPFSR